MRKTTLCYVIDEENGKILLGLKKIKLGKGKYNGFGGGIEGEETPEQAAVRELAEEAGIEAKANDLEKVAELDFRFPFAQGKNWDQIVNVFITRNWNGIPKETDEMSPKWFGMNEIPYDKMWGEDLHWLPPVLQGKKIKAWVTFKKDNDTFQDLEIKEVNDI